VIIVRFEIAVDGGLEVGDGAEDATPLSGNRPTAILKAGSDLSASQSLPSG
jgi:hypothetical protein